MSTCAWIALALACLLFAGAVAYWVQTGKLPPVLSLVSAAVALVSAISFIIRKHRSNKREGLGLSPIPRDAKWPVPKLPPLPGSEPFLDRPSTNDFGENEDTLEPKS